MSYEGSGMAGTYGSCSRRTRRWGGVPPRKQTGENGRVKDSREGSTSVNRVSLQVLLTEYHLPLPSQVVAHVGQLGCE